MSDRSQANLVPFVHFIAFRKRYKPTLSPESLPKDLLALYKLLFRLGYIEAAKEILLNPHNFTNSEQAIIGWKHFLRKGAYRPIYLETAWH